MALFTFQCPQCGQLLQCEENDSHSRIACPSCRAEFIPADMQMKKCRHCGQVIRQSALKCQYCGKYVSNAASEAAHSTGAPVAWWRNLVGIVLLAICLGAGWFVWRKISTNREIEAKNAALKAAELERDRAELERAAQLDREYKRQEERARIANEARLREEAEIARKKQQAEEKARRDAEAAQRRAEETKRRAEAERIKEEERIAFNAEIDKKIAALMPKYNAAKMRLQNKQKELERAQTREEQSRQILERKHEYSQSAQNAYDAARSQREDVEREYKTRKQEVEQIESQIRQLGSQKKTAD